MVVVQFLSCVQLFVTAWTAVHHPYPSLSPGVWSNSCPLCQWSHIYVCNFFQKLEQVWFHWKAVYLLICITFAIDFPGGSNGKKSACSTGDPDSIPELGRSPGEGNGYPLQYSCLENSLDRGAWGVATDHGVAKSRTQLKWLSIHALFIKQCNSI